MLFAQTHVLRRKGARIIIPSSLGSGRPTVNPHDEGPLGSHRYGGRSQGVGGARGSSYVSRSAGDRFSGGGPLLRTHDPNEFVETHGRFMGSPTHGATSVGDDVAAAVGGHDADFIRQQRSQQAVAEATDMQNEQVWRDSRSHIRRQEGLVRSHGSIEGAIQERLKPSTVSYRQEIRQRPLDRRILEEIYKDMHGKRSERALKKNVHWERFVAKGDGNTPVRTASARAQTVFGMGGEVTLLRSATCRAEFPVSPVPEVAFVGRTNSGRSSLINSLLNAYVCKYGHLKGTTRNADFISVAGRLVVVDMPGYGYFHPLQADPLRVRNTQTINVDYVDACSPPRQGAPSGAQRNLKRVFVCVPCVTGLQEADVSFIDECERRGLPFSVILTKTDLTAVRSLAQMADHTRARLVKYTHCHELLLAGALRLAGIQRLQTLLGNIALRDTGRSQPINADFDSIV